MSTRGGLLSFGSPAASLRVRDVGGPARRRDSGLGSDVLLFTLIISASHPGSSDAGAGNPSPASWGRGNRAPGAWTALRLVTLILGRLPPPSVPPPAPRRPPPHPPVIRRRFKSPLGQGGIRMLSHRWRAKRAPPWTAGAPGRWTAAAKRKARLARKPARRHGLTPFPRKQGAPVAPPHVEPLCRSASAQRL